MSLATSSLYYTSQLISHRGVVAAAFLLLCTTQQRSLVGAETCPTVEKCGKGPPRASLDHQRRPLQACMHGRPSRVSALITSLRLLNAVCLRAGEHQRRRFGTPQHTRRGVRCMLLQQQRGRPPIESTAPPRPRPRPLLPSSTRKHDEDQSIKSSTPAPRITCRIPRPPDKPPGTATAPPREPTARAMSLVHPPLLSARQGPLFRTRAPTRCPITVESTILLAAGPPLSLPRDALAFAKG